MKVYLIGHEYSRSLMFGGFGWSTLGIVETREQALDACASGDHFYIEWDLGQVLSSGNLLEKAYLEGNMIFPKRT
jgi:hypothetical protein